MASIFTGVRVLSLAEQYPGPFATLMLADLGADVILVERPNGGDPSRAFPAVFRSLARNKRSITIDLKEERGRRQLVELVRTSDVLLEGFRPGTMNRLGVGYETLREANPRLIYASISGFGQDGPYRERTAHDLSLQAIAGHLFDRVGTADQSVPRIAYGDLSSGMFAAFAIAAALFARERSGEGTAVDISMADGLVAQMAAYLSPAMIGEPAFEILGEPAYGIFATSDARAITLSIAHEDHFWRALCDLMEMEDAASLGSRERLADAVALRERIVVAVARRPLAEWTMILDGHSIPWSPVNSLQNVLDDVHFRERNLFASVATEDGQLEHHVMQPVKFSTWDSELRRAAPRLGEHNDEILKPELR